MPKKIDDLRQTILLHTRMILLMQGSEKLTVRAVAASCHVAVGTVYNYFPSKDMMVASVMAEDWEKLLAQIRADCEQAPSTLAGLELIFNGIRGFSKTFSPVWETYHPQVSTPNLAQSKHRQLVSQLIGTIQPMLERFGQTELPHLSRFLAESVLAGASDISARFQELQPVYEKLLKKDN